MAATVHEACWASPKSINIETVAKAFVSSFSHDSLQPLPDRRSEQSAVEEGSTVIKLQVIADNHHSKSNNSNNNNILSPSHSNSSSNNKRGTQIQPGSPVPEEEGKEDSATSRYKRENELLKRKVKELETGIKTFQQSQQQLFDDFVLLREKYDEAKSHLAEVLWKYLPANSAYCPSIPGPQENTAESSRRISDYDVGEKLGEGQFAVVYNCTRRGHRGPPLALKIINKDRISSLEALRRVDSEIFAQKTLRHRGILHVHDVINGQRGLYVVMDKAGKDLFDYLDERKEKLEEHHRQRITRSIVDAIHYCHTKGICHRDLKPENILLNTEHCSEDDPAMFDVKICDFGLCSLFTAGRRLVDFCGSPGFFAPEMVINKTYFGPPADIWSIGCILLELTVGHDLFCDKWMIAYDYELLKEPQAFQDKLQDCLKTIVKIMKEDLRYSDHLIDFLCGMLTVDPEKRWKMDQIAAHPWLAFPDGSPVLTGEQSLPTPLAIPTPTIHDLSGEELSSPTPAANAVTPHRGSVSQQTDPHGNAKRRAARPSPLQLRSDGEASLMSPSHHTTAPISPHSQDDSVGGDGSGSGSKNIFKKSAAKGRSRMEQKAKETGKDKGLQLPPLEPPTPAVGAAKRRLQQSNDLFVQEAITSPKQRGDDGTTGPVQLVSGDIHRKGSAQIGSPPAPY